MTDRDFYGNIFIYNVALIYATGDRQELRLRFDFGAEADPEEAFLFYLGGS